MIRKGIKATSDNDNNYINKEIEFYRKSYL